MSYSFDRRQSKAGAAGAIDQRNGTASIVDQRACATAHLQLRQKIDDSPIAASSATRLVEDQQARLTADTNLQAAARHGTPGTTDNSARIAAPAKPNSTGLPDNLKNGIERLSGISLDHVRVQYGSSKPALLKAHAYAQGSDIHVAPGQEKHLAHEAWHVVQQLQGRVTSSRQYKGFALNSDPRLEREADVMGARAAGLITGAYTPAPASQAIQPLPGGMLVQRYFDYPHISELRLVRRYVTALRPDLTPAFQLIDIDPDEETDLYAWLNTNMGVTMHDVYDWDDGIVRGRHIRIDDEDVRGSRDIASDSDDEVESFRIGLDEADYSADELRLLHRLLRQRGAPRDSDRRHLIVQHSDDREQAFHDENMSDDEAEMSDDEHHPFRAPFFSDSEEDSDGTDTDGSDTEENESFNQDAEFNRRHTRKINLLKSHLTKGRLDDLDNASKENRNAVMFKKGKRPKRKLFRKNTKFRHPDVNVGDRAQIPDKPTQQQIDDLATLNALLELEVPVALAEQLVESRFVVAQYRGLFYSRKTFTKSKRALHRGLDETNRSVFSSGALDSSPLGVAGFYYLYGAKDRKGALNAYQREVDQQAQQIRASLLNLRSQTPNPATLKAVGRDTENFKPKSLADIGTHFYSQSYDGYHTALKESLLRRDLGAAERPMDKLFAGLMSPGNPKVSTGDVPTHAARYAYGLKPYEGHEHEVLEPDYDESGTPRHPYSGQVYVSIHPLTDYAEDGPEQVIELQRQRRTNIAKVILPERETPFEGLLGPGRVKHRTAAKFPNFRGPYLAVYAKKYGLSRELFDAFRNGLRKTDPGSDERIFVEALLSNYLAMHTELNVVEKASDLASQQDARLVYRTGANSFGFEPPPLDGTTSSSSAPQWNTLTDLLFQGMKKKSAVRTQAPANRIAISGNGFACYIRSLVTAAQRLYNLLPADQIENMVDTVQEHLGSIGLRQVGQDIDAGGLVAAEVRRVLAQLLAGFDPLVHIVTHANGLLTQFVANHGNSPVYLYYTPGHFDLLDRL